MFRGAIAAKGWPEVLTAVATPDGAKTTSVSKPRQEAVIRCRATAAGSSFGEQLHNYGLAELFGATDFLDHGQDLVLYILGG